LTAYLLPELKKTLSFLSIMNIISAGSKTFIQF
jgi:hypothetical protein